MIWTILSHVVLLAGSSGGSAVALSTRVAPFALCEDTGGLTLASHAQIKDIAQLCVIAKSRPPVEKASSNLALLQGLKEPGYFLKPSEQGQYQLLRQCRTRKL